MKNDEWKDICLEYKRELEELLSDVEYVHDHLSSKAPKSVSKSIDLLNKVLDLYWYHIKMISYREPFEKSKTKLKGIDKNEQKQEEKMGQASRTEQSDNEFEGRFKWIYS